MPSLSHSRRKSTCRLSVTALEDRYTPSGLLGTAASYGVLGLQTTDLMNADVRVNGDEGVSQGGTLTNRNGSTITGDAYEYTAGQYGGRGTLGGVVIADADRLTAADQDALNGSLTAASQVATQTFFSINTNTTVTGNGGVNVISISGNITKSLILSGSASDIFIVNVSGTLRLRGSSRLGLSGGVTADHVLYNFTGSGTINIDNDNVVNGTLLAPQYSVLLDGTVRGAIIAGGDTIRMRSGARVNEIDFTGNLASTAPATLSGLIVQDADADLVATGADTGLGGITVDLIDANGIVTTTTSNPDGTFTFTNVAPGTYSLTFELPSGDNPIFPTAGDINGSPDTNAQVDLSQMGFVNVVLNPGDVGTGYDMGVTPGSPG